MPPKPQSPTRPPIAGIAPKAPEAPQIAPRTAPVLPGVLGPTGPVKPPLAQPIAPQAVSVAPTVVRVETYWLVTESCRVPKPGGIYYLLPKGKVLSSFGYDIPGLQAMGVPMEEVGSKHTLPKALVVSRA